MKSSYKNSEKDFVEASGIVEKLVCGGLGLLRHPDFGVCLVPQVLPKERIRFGFEQPKSKRISFHRAWLIELLEPAAERIAPSCVHYDCCGGCDWQYMGHQTQLAQKAEIVLENLQRLGADNKRDYRSLQRPVIGGLDTPDNPGDINGFTDNSWGYRQRAKFFKGSRLGFRERGSRKLLEVPGCLVVTPEIRKEIQTNGKQEPLNRAQSQAKDQVQDNDERSLHVFSVDGQCYWEEQEFCYRWRELRVYSQPRLFFQGNAPVLSLLLAELHRSFASILKHWKAPFLDLYAGVGLFSLCFASLLPASLRESSGHYFAVERSTDTFAYLQRNLSETQFVCHNQDVGAFLQQTLHHNHQALKGSFIFADPSRGGLSANVSRYLNTCEAAYILYLSCDAASFGRDIGRLNSYYLEYWQLVDFYPQTHHIEALALLQGKADS